MIKRIPFIEWAPDQEDLLGENAFQLTNGVPVGQGYCAPMGTSATASRTCGSGVNNPIDCIGAASFVGSNSKPYSYLGTGGEPRLFRAAQNTTITDKTGTTPLTAMVRGDGDRWAFAQWGDDVIATNFYQPIFVADMVSAAAFNVMITSTAKPKARSVAVARNFVILGATDGGENRVQWSAIGDNTDFDVDPATQADFTDLEADGGRVVRVYGGEYAVVMQERAIWRMTYVGSPTVWQFDQVVNNRKANHDGLLRLAKLGQNQENRPYENAKLAGRTWD